MQGVISKISQYNVYTSLHTKSVYHQVEFPVGSRLFTTFEAEGKLFLFMLMPLHPKNAVPYFQQIFDGIIKENNCHGTHANLDNITTMGKTQEKYGANTRKFPKVANECNIIFNDNKTVYS